MRRGFALILLWALLAMARAEEPRTDDYGDSLPEHAVARLGTVRFRHPDCARTIAFSPDGKYLASVGRGDTMRIWEVPSGKEASRTKGGGDDEALAWSSNGKWIVVETWERGLEFREALTGKFVKALERIGPADAVALSRDAAVCAVATIDGRVLAWDANSGSRLLEAKPYESSDRPSLALAPDGSRLWTFLKGRKPGLWDLSTGQEVALPSADTESAVRGAFSDDGSALALADADGLVRLLARDAAPAGLGTVEGGVDALSFLQDGETLVAVSRVGGQMRWKVSDHSQGDAPALQQYARHARIIGLPPSVVISRDGRYVASSGVAISLWNAATGELLSPVHGPADTPIDIEFSPDGRYVASGYQDGTVGLWDLARRALVGTYRFGEQNDWPQVAGFASSGEALVATECDGGIVVLRTPDLTPIRTITDAQVRDVALVEGGRLAIVAVEDSSIQMVDLLDGTTLQRGEARDRYDSDLGCAAVSPDGTLLAWSEPPTSNVGGIGLQVHSVETGRLVRDYPTGINWASAFWFTPDGEFLVMDGGESGKWTVWNVRTWESTSIEETDVRASRGRVSYAFDDDGRLVLRRASDLSVLWSVDPGCGPTWQGTGAVSEDGRWLITPMQDTTLLVWEVPTEAATPCPPLAASLEELWEMLGSANSWEVSCASASLVARGDEAVAHLGGRLSPPRADAAPLEALVCPPDGLKRLRSIWVLARIGSPAAMEALRALASAAGDSREGRAARSALERPR